MATATTTATKVLLLGGHGKISLHMTPLLLRKGWHVTSVIRDPSQREEILSKKPAATTSKSTLGELDVLVSSLDAITNLSSAQALLSQTQPQIVIWSAGAGGKGGAARTFAVDRDAARYVIHAAALDHGVKKFLMVSYIGSRRKRPGWFDDKDWEETLKVNNEVLPDYAKAKVEADECLVALGRQRREREGDFQDIVLRPGTLTDEAADGKGVVLGHTKARGKVSRELVARVAVGLLDTGYRGYVDMLEGEESVEKAIERVVREEIDCFEGENEEEIVKKYKL